MTNMVIDMSQDSTRPFVPRPNPLPIPTPNWDDTPVWCLQVNDQWGAHILGVLEALGQRDTWQGTEAEIDAALDNVDRLIDSFVSAVCSEGTVFIVGEIRMFISRDVLPAGWLECFGQSLLRVTYSELFAVIGTTYGQHNPDEFTLPYMRRKFPVGADDIFEGDMTLGAEGGEESHTLTAGEMPAHTHTARVQTGTGNGSNQYIQGTRSLSGALQTGSAGSDGAHENRPPFMPLVMAIYTGVLDA